MALINKKIIETLSVGEKTLYSEFGSSVKIDITIRLENRI